MRLEEKIEKLLTEKKRTYKELAAYLKLPEYELIEGLKNSTLEFRYLEKIAALLKIPLYSFFLSQDTSVEIPTKITETWDNNEGGQSPNSLIEEITLLEELLQYKKDQLKKWQ